MQLDTHRQLLSRIGTTCQHHKEISRLSGADFNVFKIVKVVHDEVRHSAFLAELLNPKGTHGQGDVFLRLFVEKLGIKDFQCENAVANVEQHIGTVTDTNGGRIDILIDDKRGNHIIIENKIYANDQDNQLIRYYNYSKQNLFYLTLHGDDASDRSRSNSHNEVKLKCGEDYKLLSYKIDILEWLEQCQKEAVSMPLLREGIAHYINLIKHLTGKSINKAMQQEIVNLLTDSPANLANGREIVSNYSEAQSQVLWGFWKALNNALLKIGIFLENDISNTVTQEKTLNFYHKKDLYFGLWIKIYEKDDLIIIWGCEMRDNICMGFTLKRNGVAGICLNEENSIFKNIVIECDPSYIPAPYWLGSQSTKPNLNFREFNSDDIFKLVNQKYLEDIVQQIAEKAHGDILFVKGKLVEMEQVFELIK